MKKFILSLPSVLVVLLALSLPISGFASSNFFTQLVKKATTSTYQDCGKTSDPGFCSCFTKAIIKGCKSQPFHPGCTALKINQYIDALLENLHSYLVICQQYEHVPGISPTECATDLKYWHENASCRQQ